MITPDLSHMVLLHLSNEDAAVGLQSSSRVVAVSDYIRRLQAEQVLKLRLLVILRSETKKARTELNRLLKTVAFSENKEKLAHECETLMAQLEMIDAMIGVVSD